MHLSDFGSVRAVTCAPFACGRHIPGQGTSATQDHPEVIGLIERALDASEKDQDNDDE